MKVFVYGTLRKEERNAYYLNGANCLYENAWVSGTLYDTKRGYPVLFLNGLENLTNKVYGEIYDVNRDTLKTMDILEGYVEGGAENVYERTVIKAHTDEGALDDVIIYVAGSTLQHCQKVIPLGDWNVYTYLKKTELYYFAYGSCMDNERFKQAEVDHHFTDIVGRGVLHDYRMQFTRSTSDGGKADITGCTDAITEGVVYKVPLEAVDYLYKREGVYIQGYRPAIVSVSCDEKEYEVLTFIGLDKQTETSPTDLYATEIIRGGTGLLSETYIEKLKHKIETLTAINR